jgi:chitin synthase
MMPTTVSVFGGSASQLGMPMPPAMQRPTSTFSMATTANPFAGPSQNDNPSDDELFMALRNYLSTQDLMTVTKKYVQALPILLIVTDSIR